MLDFHRFIDIFIDLPNNIIDCYNIRDYTVGQINFENIDRPRKEDLIIFG